MTVAEFLDWPGDATDTRYDLILGEPVAQARPSGEHSTIQGNIGGLLYMALRDRPPCRVLPDCSVARSLRDINAVGPDIAVTCQPPRRGDLTRPCLVIEVLSPGNRAETLAKLNFYAGIDSIREIVFVESERMGLIVYRRSGEGWLDAPAAILAEGALTLEILDITLPLSDIYRNVPF